MDVLGLCPLPVAPLFWRPSPSRWALTVACKATFLLDPGVAVLAPEQEPINEQENHWDDDPARSLVAPSDLVPYKPRGEVLLAGSAYAKNGEPTFSLVARLHVGIVDKSIEVVGPRLLTRDGHVREGKKWTKMPLLYERAAGGPDTMNPVGLSLAGTPDADGQIPLPSLQPPGFVVRSGAVIPPIGFGPIARSWPDRARRAGRAATDAEICQAPFGDGFDPAYLQSAPADQQIDEIRPDETLTLENLHPTHPRLTMTLPGVRPFARLEINGQPARELDLHADTLWIDTTRLICTLTFRGDLDLERPDPPGRLLVALGKGEERPDWARLAPRPKSVPPGPASAAVMIPAPPKTPVPPAPPPPRAPESSAMEIDAGDLEIAEPDGVAETAVFQRQSLPAARPAVPRPAVIAPPAPAGVAIDLVWFDPAAFARLGQDPRFTAGEAGDGARGRVYQALSRGTPTGGQELPRMIEAAGADPPLALVSGELELGFDEGAMLAAVVRAASPLLGTGPGADGKKLKDAVDLASDMLKAPLSGMPGVAEGLSAKIREAWAKVNKTLPPTYLSASTERALLEQRAYRRRELLDAPWIVGSLSGSGAEAAIPVYLPAGIAKRLPLFKRFAARVLGEVIWQQDQAEASPLAIRALALGRVPAVGMARGGKEGRV